MAEWICSFLFSAMEVMGSFYFLDTFLEKKERQGIWRYRFFFYFAAVYAAAVSGAWLSLFKCVPLILAYVVLNRFYYHVSFKQNLFFQQSIM